MVQGYQIELLAQPVQDAAPRPRQMAKAHVAAISGEVQELLRKQAIYEVPGAAEGFLSSLFAVPKEGNKLRQSVVDLRGLNQFVPHEHFKMEG